MGLITRSEASHRLKLIASYTNNAASAARDGEWTRAAECANEVQSLLSTLLPHLEEAAEAHPREVGSLSYSPPAPRVRSLGYRGTWDENGNRRTDSTGANKPPAPIVLKSRPVSVAAPPTPISLRKPIVTPPPEVKKLEETRTFDLSLMSIGEPEHYRRLQEDLAAGRPPTETNWEMTEAFDRLPPELKQQVIRRYRETGAPVSLGDL